MEVLCHRVCGVARAPQGSNQNDFLSSKRVVIIRETPNESRWQERVRERNPPDCVAMGPIVELNSRTGSQFHC